VSLNIFILKHVKKNVENMRENYAVPLLLKLFLTMVSDCRKISMIIFNENSMTVVESALTIIAKFFCCLLTFSKYKFTLLMDRTILLENGLK